MTWFNVQTFDKRKKRVCGFFFIVIIIITSDPFIEQYPVYDAQIRWKVLNKDSVLRFSYFSAAAQPVIMLKSSYYQRKQRHGVDLHMDTMKRLWVWY